MKTVHMVGHAHLDPAWLWVKPAGAGAPGSRSIILLDGRLPCQCIGKRLAAAERC